MSRYILKRLGYTLITFFIIMTITFMSMKLLPGTPFQNQDKMTAEQLELVKEHYNLNEPVIVQYGYYIWNFLHGDLGLSFQFKNRGVSEILLNKMGPSLTLGIEALVVGALLGLVLGIIAALRHNTFWDFGSTVIAVLGISIPSFVFAGFLQYIFGVELSWLPVAYWEGWQYHIMPALSLSFAVIATMARYIRMEMLDVMGQDYIKTAKSKGLLDRTIIYKHALRNALIPVITIIGPLVISILTGSLVIEKIFAIPGIGEQFVLSITTNDYPMIMGVTLLYAAMFIFIVFVVDILYVIIDPRIKLEGGDAG
ncbi:ABC transporter permease [Virgibacillus sp. FSP13]